MSTMPIIVEQTDGFEPCLGPSLTINCLVNKLEGMPVPQYVYRGIIKPSLGAFFGPGKTGKTTLVENLAMSIAAGRKDFMGDKIHAENPRVLLISLEEFYRNRTERNNRQICQFTKEYGLVAGWEDNVIVVDDSFPRYFFTDEHWKLLEKEIERVRPSIVMIDSLTRLMVDPIEDSSSASRLMKRLRDITHRQEVAMILIHHSQKMDNRPLTLASLAGSRVVGQELDFMIGVNRTSNNTRYLKDVAYRYAPDDADHVLKFTIDDNQIVRSVGLATESSILLGSEMPKLNANDDLLLQHFTEITGGDVAAVVKTGELYDRLVSSGAMSKPTLHASLERLIKAAVLIKISQGAYSLKMTG